MQEGEGQVTGWGWGKARWLGRRENEKVAGLGGTGCRLGVGKTREDGLQAKVSGGRGRLRTRRVAGRGLEVGRLRWGEGTGFVLGDGGGGKQVGGGQVADGVAGYRPRGGRLEAG